jgi:hypothetical protein
MSIYPLLRVGDEQILPDGETHLMTEERFTHTPVVSSNVASVAHDPATNTLEVRYRNDGTYQYADVSAEDFDRLQKAKSVGSHLHQHIKGRCACKKVG